MEGVESNESGSLFSSFENKYCVTIYEKHVVQCAIFNCVTSEVNVTPYQKSEEHYLFNDFYSAVENGDVIKNIPGREVF